MLPKKRRSVILNLELSNSHVFLNEVANQFIYLFDLGKTIYNSFMLTLNTFEDVIQPLAVEM